MRRTAILVSILLGLAMTSCSTETDQRKPGVGPDDPPRATQRPRKLTAHGHTRTDEYYWLRDDERTDPEVLGYLEAENAYADERMAHLQGLQQTLFEELKGRIKQDDETVPYREGEWYYQMRFIRAGEYPVYLRHLGSETADEEVILDVNELARGQNYFHVGGLTVSDDGRYLAYAEDSRGREEYALRIKDLRTGTLLPDTLERTSAAIAWGNDNETLYYIRLQQGTLIPFQVWRHALGTASEDDVLVYEEPDDAFELSLGKSRCGNWIVVASSQTVTDEYRLIDANDAQKAPHVVLPREQGHEYSVEPIGKELFVLTNWQALNFRLMRTDLAGSADRTNWTEVVPARDDVLVSDFLVFDEYLVLNERKDGVLRLRVLDRQADESHYIAADEAAFTMTPGANPNTDTDVLRYEYTSMVTPDTVVDYRMGDRLGRVRKVDEIPGGYDPSEYATTRLEVPARDGDRVPVTLFYRKELRLNRGNPLLQDGYGAYGLSYDPEFSANRLSLADRGFVVALAHVRGGEELGRRWYDEGRVLKKKNTFTDFVDVTRFLIEEGWAQPEMVAATGASAGGLLMGVIANTHPDLYRAVVAEVPFVDVITSMLDESIPLTTFEFDEWGNPTDKTHYDYMLSYSPYDQVAEQAYPDMLVTAGLHDPRVQYWEPAKWVARLRERKTGTGLLLFKTNMEAGHFDASGRFEVLKETAMVYAFVLDRLGLAR